MEEGVSNANANTSESRGDSAQVDADSDNTDAKFTEKGNSLLNIESDVSDNNAEVVVETENTDCSAVSTPEEEQLCGWLHHRARGIGNFKLTRLRYFKFSEDNCRLYIYSDPHDLVPIGEINIVNASFYFDAANIDKPGQFQIKSDGKEIILDAGSRTRMMTWLQALQKKRREFNLNCVSSLSDHTGVRPKKRSSDTGGLLSKDAASISPAYSADGSLNEPIPAIPDIVVPEDRGSNSSINAITPTVPKPTLWGLNSFKSEIQNAFSNIKMPGKSLSKETQPAEGCIFYCDANPTTTTTTTTTTNNNSDTRSVSTTSLNSDDCLLLQDEFEFSSTQSGTDSGRAISIASSSSAAFGSELSSISEDKCALTPDSELGRGSWLMVDASEMPSEQTTLVRSKSDTTALFGARRQKVKTEGVIERSERSQADGRLKGFMSNIKKIGMSKRQVSVPGSLGSVGRETGVTCPRCKNTIGPDENGSIQVSDSGKDIEDLEAEAKANKEIIALLQKQLAQESEARQKANELGEEDKTNRLVELEQEVSTLQTTVQQLRQQSTITMERLRNMEQDNATYKEQAGMYKDMLDAKDQTIMKLTNQIYDHDHEQPTSRSSSFEQPDVVQPSRGSTAATMVAERDQREIERLKDMCQGYELQHKFLTKEILELNDLRKNDLARERQLMMEYEKMKAKYYQTKSKYYVVLKEQKENSPVSDSEKSQEVINQLLQDACEPDEEELESKLTGSVKEYDHYGFSRKHYMENMDEQHDENHLGSRAAMLERQSEQLNAKVKYIDHETSLRVKWDNYMNGRGCKLHRSQDLKNLIRQGVPEEHRANVWKGCIHFYVGEKRAMHGPEYYQQLLQKKANISSDPSVKQIELDLLRTLPNNKHYETIESDGISQLRNILLAFSEHNKVIGYCQGLNRLAAIALLFLPEEDAFWCLVAIVEHILPQDYFSSTLIAAQADQRVLKDLIQEKLPKVYQVLIQYGVELSMFTFNWFLTIYVDGIPVEMFLRIWDTFLYEGSKVLFRFAVAFLKYAENDIVQQTDGLQLNRLLRIIGDKMYNVKQISWYAFHWINPFSMRFLATRRQHHLNDIRVELSELDRLRHGIKMSREKAQQQAAVDFSDDDS